MKKDSIDVNSLAHTKWDCKYHKFMEQQESLNCDFEDVAEKFQLVEPLKQ